MPPISWRRWRPEQSLAVRDFEPTGPLERGKSLLQGRPVEHSTQIAQSRRAVGPEVESAIRVAIDVFRRRRVDALHWPRLVVWVRP